MRLHDLLMVEYTIIMMVHGLQIGSMVEQETNFR